ncbi:FeoB-associated Cys-rich membrane protein [Arcobacter sp. FWKO B]|nr:FeoB-associated Cys-rich membrane protein [Arcobacter sp. FWKO B]QOG12766.1 FeoB-associated Cys-rich membrane protein [Arcobacter sp. FWKO B]
MLETIFIGAVFAWAVYFIYKSLFKSSGCGCGKNSCSKK